MLQKAILEAIRKLYFFFADSEEFNFVGSRYLFPKEVIRVVEQSNTDIAEGYQQLVPRIVDSASDIRYCFNSVVSGL